VDEGNAGQSQGEADQTEAEGGEDAVSLGGFLLLGDGDVADVRWAARLA
jgi:hypothetical protein